MKPFISIRTSPQEDQMKVLPWIVEEKLIYIEFEVPTSKDLATMFYVIPNAQEAATAFIVTNWEQVFDPVANLAAKKEWQALVEMSPTFSLLTNNTIAQKFGEGVLIKLPDPTDEGKHKWCVTIRLSNVDFDQVDGYLNDDTIPLFNRTVRLSLLLFTELIKNEPNMRQAKLRGLTGGGLMPKDVPGFGLHALATAFNVDPAILQFL